MLWLVGVSVSSSAYTVVTKNRQAMLTKSAWTIVFFEESWFMSAKNPMSGRLGVRNAGIPVGGWVSFFMGILE